MSNPNFSWSFPPCAYWRDVDWDLAARERGQLFRSRAQVQEDSCPLMVGVWDLDSGCYEHATMDEDGLSAMGNIVSPRGASLRDCDYTACPVTGYGCKHFEEFCEGSGSTDCCFLKEKDDDNDSEAN